MEELSVIIGHNLRRMRKERGLSLDGLSELTGVSKGRLGQIERGESNPTVSMLWRIAGGLKVSFTSLMERKKPAVSVVRQDMVTPVVEESGKYKVYPLFPFDQVRRFEVFAVELETGCCHKADAHNDGVEEYIMVVDGILVLRLGEETVTVNRGDAVSFAADRCHEYCNESGEPVKLHMVISYP